VAWAVDGTPDPEEVRAALIAFLGAGQPVSASRTEPADELPRPFVLIPPPADLLQALEAPDGFAVDPGAFGSAEKAAVMLSGQIKEALR
jgi:hypothetical protein